MSKINIKINGKDIELENVSTIQEMLIARKVTGEMFVVEKNLEIIPKDKYDTKIQDNDVIEIVGFFGGGWLRAAKFWQNNGRFSRDKMI